MSTTRLAKADLDSFFEASGRSFTTESGPEHFGSRIIISTTDHWSSHAEEALANQLVLTSRIGTAAIAESPINWDVAFPGSGIQINLSQRETFEPRPHQQEAIDSAMAGFATHDRGKLIMACGTGKTFTALRLAERAAEGNSGPAGTPRLSSSRSAQFCQNYHRSHLGCPRSSSKYRKRCCSPGASGGSRWIASQRLRT